MRNWTPNSFWITECCFSVGRQRLHSISLKVCGWKQHNWSAFVWLSIMIIRVRIRAWRDSGRIRFLTVISESASVCDVSWFDLIELSDENAFVKCDTCCVCGICGICGICATCCFFGGWRCTRVHPSPFAEMGVEDGIFPAFAEADNDFQSWLIG